MLINKMQTADRTSFGRRFFIRFLPKRRFVISTTYEDMDLSSYVVKELRGGGGLAFYTFSFGKTVVG